MAEMGLLTSMITHEINNPLSVISSSISLIKRKSNLDEIGLKYISNIEKSYQRIESTIKQIKNFVRNDNCEDSNFDLVATLDDTLDFISPKIKNVKIIKKFNKISPVKGNSSQFSQVLINLITNAVDAMEKESNPWIEIACYEEANFIF